VCPSLIARFGRHGHGIHYIHGAFYRNPLEVLYSTVPGRDVDIYI
jgi:hypothetical protein